MKRFRYTKIKEIVQSRPIETQEELAKALQEEGIEVTQATVSRDIIGMLCHPNKTCSCPRVVWPGYFRILSCASTRV